MGVRRKVGCLAIGHPRDGYAFRRTARRGSDPRAGM